MPDRLVADDIRIRDIDHEAAQAQTASGLLLAARGLLADEVRRLVVGDEAVEAGLERTVDRPVLAGPGAVGLLEAQRIQRTRAEQPDAVRLARRHQRIEDVDEVRGFAPDLVADVAGVADASHQRRGHADRDALDVHEAELRRGEVRRGHGREHLARARTGDREARETGAVGDDGHRAVGRQMLLEPAHVVVLGQP